MTVDVTPLPMGPEPTLQDVAAGIWKYRWRVLGASMLLTGLAIGIAYRMTPIYRAETVLMAADSGAGSSGLAGLTQRLGGLTSLIGLPVGQPGANVEEALAVLQSREFLGQFITERDIINLLFPEIWNSASQRWDVPEADVPTTEDAYKLFSETVMTVTRNVETGTITVAIEWADPALAAGWTNELVARLNDRMRDRAIEEASKSIEYLNRELERTRLVSMQESINRLIEENIGRTVIAKTRAEYTFKIIDRAVAPELDDFVRPRRFVIGAVAFLASLALSALVAALVHINRTFPWRREQHRDA